MGSTTLPARSLTRSVTMARADANTEGLGYSPPNGWKCRSGSHTAANSCVSANLAPSIRSRYLSSLNSASLLEK